MSASPQHTPTPPPHAQSAASAVHASPRITIHAAAAQRGPKSSGALHKDEGDIFLDVLKKYEQNSVALIFCVDKYPNAKEGEVKLNDLDCAVADGRKAAEMLQQQGFEVSVFGDEQVTKKTIDRELERVIKRFPFKSPTIGRFYMMLAGHGLKDDATRASVFCCSNFTADNEYGTSYPLDELKKKLQHIGLKHQCVHLDCCHAGGIFAANRSRHIDYSVVQHAKMPVVQAITAVTRDEKALESDGNGLFTKHLCEEIVKGWIFKRFGADVVTLSQVFNATRGKVTEKARESQGKMTPMHKDVLNEHLNEPCCGEMLFFRPGMSSQAWALKKSAPVATKKTAKERGAAAPQPTLTPAMQAWAQAQKIQGMQALANALNEFGVAEVTDLELLDEEDVTMICGALKKVDAKKFKKALNKQKAQQSTQVKPVPVEEVKPVPVEEEVQAAAVDAQPGESKRPEVPPMSAKVAKMIEKALKEMADGATKLNLGSDNIGEAGAIAIADALPQSKLTSLIVSSNNIGAAGASAIADALPQSKLTSLYLGNNKIGEAGLSKIADALPQSKLTYLYLRRNNIGDAGASKIADALPQSKLTDLHLRGNNIGDAGASAIADALPQSKLTVLFLEKNNIGDAMKKRLKACKNAAGDKITVYV